MRSHYNPWPGRCGWIVALLLTLAPAARAQGPKQPVFVGTMQSVDALLDSVRYVLKTAGKEDQAQQLDGLLSVYLGNDGVKGLDTKRPLGVMLAKVPEPAGEGEPPVVLFLPVTKEQEFIDFLQRLNVTASKEEKGLRSVDLPTGQKVYLRFAHNYVFAAQHEATLEGDLPDPAKALPPAAGKNLIALTFRIDQIPAEHRQKALAKLDEEVAKEQDKKENETDAEARGRQAGMAFARTVFASLLEEGREFTLTFDLDRGKNVLNFDATLTAKPGTKLASQLQTFGSARSTFAALANDAAWSGVIRLPLAQELRAKLNDLIDVAVKGEMEKEKSFSKRVIAKKVYETIEPTLKSDVIDVAAALRGPGADSKFVGVFAMKVRDGKKIEQLVRDLVGEMKPDERKAVTLDRPRSATSAFIACNHPRTTPRLSGSSAAIRSTSPSATTPLWPPSARVAKRP